MRRRRSTSVILFLVIVAAMASGLRGPSMRQGVVSGDAVAGPVLYAAGLSEGVKNFFLLQKHYQSWHDGYFGSRHYHEGRLRSFLLRLLGREITTENDFMLVSPEGIYDKKMVCIFPNFQWLYIHGDLDVESLKKNSGMDYAAMKGWWRSGILVTLTGKIKNFKLDWDARGDTVHLYLEKVTVFPDNVKK